MIYFDENKEAYAYAIPNYIATIDDFTWHRYAGTDKWDIVDGVFTDITTTAEYQSMKLAKAKALKIAENEQKRNVSKIETTLGYLKTETPLGDLKTALPLYSNIANANGGLPQGAVRLYDRYGDIVLSPAITIAEFNALLLEISMAYIAIDTKSTQITQAIQEAETLAELEEIVIKYEDEFELRLEEEPPFVPEDVEE